LHLKLRFFLYLSEAEYSTAQITPRYTTATK